MSVSFSAAPKRGFFDGMAIGLSGLCLLHCLALPVMVMILPNLSVAGYWPEEMHFIAALLAASACFAAIAPRWAVLDAGQHLKIGMCAAIGLLSLFGAMALSDHWAETVVTVIGSVFLIAAHVQNLRL